jgi:hypothetical protein
MSNAPSDIPEEKKGPTTVTVTLDTPIVRGAQTIDQVTLRKPDSGALRGLTLVDLSQLDVNALHKVLPRISQPTLTPADCQALDPADLLALGAEVSGFLLQKAKRPAYLDE